MPSILWPLYPWCERDESTPTIFRTVLFRDVDPGTISYAGPGFVRPACKPWHKYAPTPNELATLASAYPDAALDAPPWHRIRADLLTAGERPDWENTTSADAIAMLSPATPSAGPTHDAPPERPIWDRQRRQLRLGDQSKAYRQRAPNQQAILDAFQQAGWPTAILNPLPFGAKQLDDTLRRMNATLPVHFRSNGNGGIVWEAKKRKAPGERR